MIKTTRPIGVKSINIPTNDFYSLFNKLSYWQTNMMNAKMMEEYSKARGYEVKVSAFVEAKKNISNSYIRAMGNQEARNKWGANAKKILRGDITLPTFKNKRLFIGNKGFKFIREDDNFFFDVSLTDETKNYIRLQLMGLEKMKWKSPNQYIALERIFSREYIAKSAQLFKDKYIYVRIPYHFEPVLIKDLNPERIMGIDLGIKNPAVCAFNDSPKRKYFDAEGIRLLKVKEEFIARYRGIIKQVTRKNSRVGKGKDYKLSPLNKLKNKWNFFRKTFNHRLTKGIIDFAIENQAGIIQFENLNTGNNTFLGRQWPVAELLFFLEYKAKQAGIATKRINPRYTSQRCSRCGAICEEFDFKTRVKQRFPSFKCLECGLKLPCDYNAAKNIATKNIEKLISEKLDSYLIDKETKENTIEEAFSQKSVVLSRS